MNLTDMRYYICCIVGEDKPGPLLSQVKSVLEILLWCLLDKGPPRPEEPE